MKKYTHWVFLALPSTARLNGNDVREHITSFSSDNQIPLNSEIGDVMKRDLPNYSGDVWIKNLTTTLTD